MLLNCFAQPTLLTRDKSCLFIRELKKAPLLLCHKNAMEETLLPPDWSGKVFATQEILDEIKLRIQTFQSVPTQALSANETYIINMDDDKACQHKAKKFEITPIPWDGENLMYIIKDDTVINLLTDVITEDMAVFVQNKFLRDSIKSGIDVLYVNDGCYNLKKCSKYPSEFLLGALVTLVRPNFVRGIFSEDQLPPHMENCCVNLN